MQWGKAWGRISARNRTAVLITLTVVAVMAVGVGTAASQSTTDGYKKGDSVSIEKGATAHDGTQYQQRMTGRVKQVYRNQQGDVWYKVATDKGSKWLKQKYVGEFMQQTQTEPQQQFEEGESVMIDAGVSSYNDKAFDSSTLGKVVDVYDGQSTFWYKVKTDMGPRWYEQDQLSETDETWTPPQPEFEEGESVMIDAGASPYNGDAVETATLGKVVDVYDGQTTFWYKVKTDMGPRWYKEAQLSETDRTWTPPEPEFEEGESVMIDAGASSYSEKAFDASTLGKVVRVYDAQGKFWYKIKTDRGPAWFKEEQLTETDKTWTPPEPEFEKGESVIIKAGANSYNQETFDNGMLGRVKQVYDYRGKFWYKVESDRGTFWFAESELSESDQTYEEHRNERDSKIEVGDHVQVVRDADGYRSGDQVTIERGTVGKVVEMESDGDKTVYGLVTNQGSGSSTDAIDVWVPADAVEKAVQAA
jgi:ribosomal protein L21E